MGNKSAARKTMMDAGVPVVPGTKDAVYEAEAGQKIADDMGYPVMIKASAGGGGKGMRVCYDSEDFVHTFETAKLEAENAFGDGTMYIENISKIHAISNSRFLLINTEIRFILEKEIVLFREDIRN